VTMPKAEAAKPPIVSDAVKLSVWRAMQLASEADAALKATPQWKESEKRQAALQEQITVLATTCGPDFVPQRIPDDIVCAAKPEPPKPDAKP